MDTTLWHLIDLLLALLLVGLAWAAMAGTDLKRGVILFIAFGLLLSLIWARLRAPDLALAEAAIGAGLSGALLLSALRDESGNRDAAERTSTAQTIPITLLSLGIAAAVGWAYVTAISLGDADRLATLALARLDESGVSNPVTAVLLNFRAYDTLLELAVLLAAALGILALGPACRPYRQAGALLGSLIRWLVPLLIVTAGYLLWAGAHAPGGAFQAGAMLAAVIVILRLGGFEGAYLPAPDAQRWLLAGGIAAFVLCGLLVTLFGLAFLEYPDGLAGALILVIESAATLSITLALGLAYLGGHAAGWKGKNNPETKP